MTDENSPEEVRAARARSRAYQRLQERLRLGGVIHTPGNPNNRRQRREEAARKRKAGKHEQEAQAQWAITDVDPERGTITVGSRDAEED